MKIVYISLAPIPSKRANGIQVMKVCQAMAQNGHDVLLLVPGETLPDWEEIKTIYGISTRFAIQSLHSRGIKPYLDYVIKALRLAKKTSSDLVYTRMIWAAWLAVLMNLKVIYEIHDLPTGRVGKQLFRMLVFLRKKILFVSITRALIRKIETQQGISMPVDSTIVAPDGVDLERYATLPDAVTSRKRLNLAEKITAVYSGGFYAGRGVDFLFSLAANNPNVQFLWIGGDEQSVQFWRNALKRKAIQNVHLTGFIPNAELPLYQAAADILLMPSGKSTSGSSGGNIADICSPMKMFEYLASGRAILTSDLPVFREVLDESCSMFFQVEDFEHFQTQFKTLLDDHRLRGKLGANAAKKAIQYDWRKRMESVILKAQNLFADLK